MRHTNEERIKLTQEVDRRVAEGETVRKASKSLGISQASYNNWVKKLTPKAVRPQGARRAKLTVEKISIPSPAHPRCAAVIGSPEDIADILRRLS